MFAWFLVVAMIAFALGCFVGGVMVVVFVAEHQRVYTRRQPESRQPLRLLERHPSTVARCMPCLNEAKAETVVS